MSFNLSTRLNNLYQVVQNIQTTALTNPMVANLNMASYSVNNATSVNAPASTPIAINADPNQGLVINTKVSIPNHPLIITNNTTNDSLVVGDALTDPTVFRVDTNGNVAIKSNPSATLTSDFTVNGSASITGALDAPSITTANLTAGNVVNNITAGAGLAKTGTSQNPTLTNTGVLAVSAGSGVAITGTASNPIISSSGLTGLTSTNAGTGVAITGTATNPTISATGIQGITSANAGTGVAITGTATNPTISNSGLLGLSTSNAGAGIAITGSTVNPSITNTGVINVTAGTGISLGGSTSNPVINNAGLVGLTSANALTGITIGGSPTNPTIKNNGIVAINSGNAGTGITIGGTDISPIFNNAGVLATSAGNGIGISGTVSNPVISNTGVLSVSAGSNISVSQTTGNITISATVPPPPAVQTYYDLTPEYNGGGGGASFTLQLPTTMGYIKVEDPDLIYESDVLDISLPTSPCAFYFYCNISRGTSIMMPFFQFGTYSTGSSPAVLNWYVYYSMPDGQFKYIDLNTNAPYNSAVLMGALGS